MSAENPSNSITVFVSSPSFTRTYWEDGSRGSIQALLFVTGRPT